MSSVLSKSTWFTRFLIFFWCSFVCKAELRISDSCVTSGAAASLLHWPLADSLGHRVRVSHPFQFTQCTLTVTWVFSTKSTWHTALANQVKCKAFTKEGDPENLLATSSVCALCIALELRAGRCLVSSTLLRGRRRRTKQMHREQRERFSVRRTIGHHFYCSRFNTPLRRRVAV